MSNKGKRKKRPHPSPGVKVKDLIEQLRAFHPESQVMILVPIRKDQHQTEFVTTLHVVADYEWNELPDSPMLVTEYWHKPVGAKKGERK